MADDGPAADDGPGDDGDAAGSRPTCPFCGSVDVELESAFGGEVSKTRYYCNGCRTVFERIKYDGRRPDTGR